MSGNVPRTTQTILEQMDAEYALARTEPRAKFLKDVCDNAIHWATVGRSKEDVATGVTFSLLAMMDGCQVGSPPIDLAYNYSVEDHAEPGVVFNDTAVGLHDDFYPTYRDRAAELDFPASKPKDPHCLNSTIGTPDLMMGELVASATRALQRGNAELWMGSPEKEDMAKANALCMVSELMADGLIPSAVEMANDQNVKCLNSRGGNAQLLAAQIIADMTTVPNAKPEDTADAVDVAQPESFNTVVPPEQRIEQFVDNCANIVDYWSEQADTPAEAAEGTMMSVLTMLDGAGDVPPMDLVPAVVPELIAEYNEVGTAGWPAEPINSKISLSEAYTENVMQRKRRQAAEALSGE
jgi:hypothetical protein